MKEGSWASTVSKVMGLIFHMERNSSLSYNAQTICSRSSLLFNGHLGWWVYAVDPSPPSNAEIKNMSALPPRFHSSLWNGAQVQGQFTFYFKSMITYSETEKDGYSAGISPVTTDWWMKQLKGESTPSFIDLGEMISLWYHNTATF
jgi:hypothetical protein